MLSAAAAFARDHDLVDVYRARFRGIEPQDLLPERAAAKRRTISSPIWVIAHELVVARFLERVLGWTYVCHEPVGHQGRRGDWEFRTSSDRRVFVEVKTLEEPERHDTSGVYSRSVNDSQIRDVVKGAYQQLPDDDRATLVVLAGRGDTLSVSHGILFSDIGQTMFGRFQVRFTPMSDNPNYRAGPSLRDRMVHGTKHRRIGCVAGLWIAASGIPLIRFYAIDNPDAHPGKRLPECDLIGALRFMVDERGGGEQKSGVALEEVWALMAAGV